MREILLTDADGLPRDLSYAHYRGDRICFTGGGWRATVPVPGPVP